jgi:hypothetical protein
MKNQNKADDTEELNIQYLDQKSEYKERRASNLFSGSFVFFSPLFSCLFGTYGSVSIESF